VSATTETSTGRGVTTVRLEATHGFRRLVGPGAQWGGSDLAVQIAVGGKKGG
jgi:hypothetical protein